MSDRDKAALLAVIDYWRMVLDVQRYGVMLVV